MDICLSRRVDQALGEQVDHSLQPRDLVGDLMKPVRGSTSSMPKSNEPNSLASSWLTLCPEALFS